MDESDFDFEFDFLPDRAATATLDHEDEEPLWDESDPELSRRRRAPAAATPPQIVKRRRIAAAAAVAVLLLIIIIVVATSGGGGGGRYGNYVSDVSPIAQDSQQTGAALGSLSRGTAVAKLDALIQQTVDDVNRLQALTPPSTLAAVQAQGLAALDLRLLGLQELRDAVSAGAGSSTDVAVATLVASDRIWDGSVRTPANAVLQARGLGGTFPASAFVADRKALATKLDTLLGTSATTSTSGVVLKLGDKGPDVVSWQNGLNQWITASGSTTLTPLTADGTFGAGTQSTTIALQTAQGLSPDGIVGPSTRQALQTAIKAAKATPTTTAPTLKLGDTGQDVSDWQTKLNQWLKITAPTQTPLTADGNFGQATQTATEQLQTASGLTPTGAVDAQTRQALTSALANAGPGRG